MSFFFLRLMSVIFAIRESLEIERDVCLKLDSSFLDRAHRKCSTESKGKKKDTFTKLYRKEFP